MEFRLLGTLEVAEGARVLALPAHKPRALLALLALHANAVVGADRLADELWVGSPPASAAATLQTYVSQVRRALGGGDRLQTRQPGYLLRVGPDELDVSRFEALSTLGRGHLARSEMAAAADVLRAALTLWRGPALADFDEPFARAAAVRLDEDRQLALEGRVTADLALGRHAELIGELEELCAAEPLREPLWAQLMLALYRADRQADALARFQVLRQRLGDELGLHPGAALVRLERDILRQEPALDWVPPFSAGQLRSGSEPHNLPAGLTRFVGREDEVAALTRLLRRTRLVTVTGPGGIGKSRLAVEVAGWLVGEFIDGVWMVELAGLSEPRLLAHHVLQALDVAERPGEGAASTLQRHLGTQHVLLLLDNCEHLASAVSSLVVELLRACPRLAVLATSRELLGVPGEAGWQVRPLSVPDPEQLPDVEDLVAYEAVRLFLDRARGARPGFELRDDDAVPIATICRRLDGVPLALELAAARVVALAPAEIARRLDHRFALLSGGARGAPARHQSLRALVEWSHDLLDLEERVLLRRLSVFRGGCDLLAVEQVADGADLAASRVASVLASLVSKSMVTVEHGPGSRFRLLETVQSYAAERLDAAGESDAVGAAHLRWCRGLPPESLGLEQENVREALGWAVAAGEVASGLELAVQMTPFWLQRGHPSEGRHWLELLRERETRAAAWGPGLAAAGRLALAQGDLEGAAGLLADARPLVLADGSPEEVVDLLTAVGTVAAMGGDHVVARDAFEEALGKARTSGRRADEARLLRGLGNLAKEDGDFESARSLYEEALALARTTGATRDVAALLNNLGVVAKLQGDLEDARSLFEESLVHKAPLGDRRGLAVSHSNLGALAVDRADAAEAAVQYGLATELFRGVDAADGLVLCIWGFAAAAALRGDQTIAVQLLAAHDALRDRLGYPLPPADRPEHDRVVVRARRGLPAATIADATAAGAALDIEPAIALALSCTPPPDAAP